MLKVKYINRVVMQNHLFESICYFSGLLLLMPYHEINILIYYLVELFLLV